MPHTLTPNEAHALHFHALALRPDWEPNNPGHTWHQTINGYTLPHATNYPHAHAALTHYATTTNTNGQPAKRTPNLYPAEGTHWDQTRPDPAVGQPRRPCEDHPEFEARSCRCCLADVKVGERPVELVGRRLVVPGSSGKVSGWGVVGAGGVERVSGG